MADMITEAFKELQILKEENFNVDRQGILMLDSFLDGDNLEDTTVAVVDKEAEDEEDLKDSYMGKVIFECPSCGTLSYFDKDEIEIESDDELANVSDECPYCGSVGGFKIVGEIVPYREETKVKVSSDKDEEDVVESYRKRHRGLKEADGEEAGNDNSLENTSVEKEFQKLANTSDYSAFVKILDKDIKSKEFLNYLNAHYKDGDDSIGTLKKANPSIGKIKCGKLIPTQNNISLSKSLGMIGGDGAGWAISIINDPLTAFNDPTIVYDGKYIIDGHHRWSKAYALDGKDADIEVLNFPAIEGVDWKDMLKAVQLAVASTGADNLINKVGEDNMLTTSREAIEKFVINNAADSVVQAFNQKFGTKSKEEMAKKVADNCEDMKATSQPVSGAPDRDYMPQTNGSSLGKLQDVGVLDMTEELMNESDKPAATSIEDAQKWVDYDMKRYGKISARTNYLVRKAGFQILKDDHGDYEVAAGHFEGLKEDTVKQGNYWVNKGKEGTHGKFKTKKAADAQRRAMFAQGYEESLKEEKSVAPRTRDDIDAIADDKKEKAKAVLARLRDDADSDKDYQLKRNKLKESAKANTDNLSVFIKHAVEEIQSGEIGTWYYKIGSTKNGTELYYVIGLADASDYDEDSVKLAFTDDTGKYIIVGKIAVNSSDLKADYDVDWTQPYDKESGDVFDTEETITKDLDYKSHAREILNEFDDFIKYEIDSDGAIIRKYGDKWERILSRINNTNGQLKIESMKKVGENNFDFVASGYNGMFKILFHTHYGPRGWGDHSTNGINIDSIEVLESEIPEKELKTILTPNYMIWDQGKYKLEDYLIQKHVLRYSPNGNGLVFDTGATVYLPDNSIEYGDEDSIKSQYNLEFIHRYPYNKKEESIKAYGKKDSIEKLVKDLGLSGKVKIESSDQFDESCHGKKLKEQDEDIHVYIEDPEPDIDFDIYEERMVEDGIVIAGNRDFKEKGDPDLIEIIEDSDKDFVLQELEAKTGKPYTKDTIRGSDQRDWNMMYYPVGTSEEFLNDLEDYYFGNCSAFYPSDSDAIDDPYITIPDYLGIYEKEDIKKYIAQELGVPENKVKIRKFIGYSRVANYDESCHKNSDKKKLKEAPIYGLTTQFDSRKSFGGKAQVDVQGDKQTLYSYDTPVAKIEAGKVTLLPKWDLSATTLRHVKEFLKQNGFKAETRNQIAADYAQEMEEACGKSIKKTFKKVKEDKTSKTDRIDAKRDNRVENARKALKKTIDDADAQRDDEKKKLVKEDLSYGELVTIDSEWEKFKKKKGKSDADTAWEFIETECKGVYDTDEEKEALFGYISALEEPSTSESLIGDFFSNTPAGTVVKLAKGLTEDAAADVSKAIEFVKAAGDIAKVLDDHSEEIKGAATSIKNLKDKIKGFIKKAGIKDGETEAKFTSDIDSKPDKESIFATIKNWIAKGLRLTESLEKVELETDNEKITISSEQKEIVEESEEAIVPVSTETADEILSDEEPVEGETSDEDITVDSFEDSSVDELGESYLKEVYENVKSFKTSSITKEGNKIKVEGLINFNSGANKKTTFTFAPSKKTKSGKVKLLGENLDITKNKNAFTISGKLSGGKLIAESLTYNYGVKTEDKKTQRIYGRVQKKSK